MDSYKRQMTLKNGKAPVIPGNRKNGICRDTAGVKRIRISSAFAKMLNMCPIFQLGSAFWILSFLLGDFKDEILFDRFSGEQSQFFVGEQAGALIGAFESVFRLGYCFHRKPPQGNFW